MTDLQQLKVGAIILAAGYSSRMGQLKALMKLDGISLLKRNINLFALAGFENLWVVTGHEHQRVAEVLEREPVTATFNAQYDHGMFSSIKAGLFQAQNLDGGCFIMPVDCPLVKLETLMRLVEAMKANPQKLIVPTFHDKRGHPIFIPRVFFDEIFRYSGPDGLKGITEKYRQDFIEIAVEDEGILIDVDDWEGYQFAQQYIEAGQQSVDLLTLARGRKFFFIRHGQTRQHAEKIFLGQTDISLSDIGKNQAQEAARELFDSLNKNNEKTKTIFCSDLSRAAETAKIIASFLGMPEVRAFRFLREMNLGDWDGKEISIIAKQQPDEYAFRGTCLMKYKIGNRAENFYDLQYRVCRGLAELLKSEKNEEIIIVAHQSVIRAMVHNLNGVDISAPWVPMRFGEVRHLSLD